MMNFGNGQVFNICWDALPVRGCVNTSSYSGKNSSSTTAIVFSMRSYTCLTQFSQLSIDIVRQIQFKISSIFHQLCYLQSVFLSDFVWPLSSNFLPVWFHMDSQGQPLFRPASLASWQTLSSNVLLAPFRQHPLRNFSFFISPGFLLI